MTVSIHRLGNGRDAGSYYTNDPEKESRTRRNDYYSREGNGSWWSTSESLVRHGATIDKDTFSDLCAGYDPKSGKALVRGAGPTHRAGWDLTFSAPKSFSILWMSGTPKQRELLEAMRARAVDEALRFLTDEKLVDVRLGSAGSRREAPTDLIVGRFPHYTSREGDPHVHEHCVLLNCAKSPHRIQREGERQRGPYNTIDPARTYGWQLLLGLAFRAALSEQLHQHGFKTVPAGRDQFEISGIPFEMIEAFSKRSVQIQERVGTSASAAQKELAALQTRVAKEDVASLSQLEQRWTRELAAFPIDPWVEAQNAHKHTSAQLAIDRDLVFNPPEVPGNTPVAQGASALFRHHSVIDKKQLLQKSLTIASLQGIGISDVRSEIERLESKNDIFRLNSGAISPHWTTPSIAAAESNLLRIVEGDERGRWFSPSAVEAALSHAPHLSDEQRQAVRHAASTHAISLVQAGAGTGKTTLTFALASAAIRSDLKVISVTPSWAAADELSKATGIEAVAIARFRHEIETGLRPLPDSRTLIIIDEGGMVGTKDLVAVLRASRGTTDGNRRTGSTATAKVVIISDQRQLAAVSGGSPINAISNILERKVTLSEVRRQQVGWQRTATILMAQGDSEAGLRCYVKEGFVDFAHGANRALIQTIENWQQMRSRYGQDVILITRRNKDVATLNQQARVVLRSEKLLLGDDFPIVSASREGQQVDFVLAVGDQIRFGEGLPQHRIRNGNRATVRDISRISGDDILISIQLENGRLLTERWSGLVSPNRTKQDNIPRITHAYAGTVYTAQGRTASAAVLHIASPTDAREIYVSLSRHRSAVRIVVDVDRIDAACRARQEDPRIPPTHLAVLDQLYSEARQYSEKKNVIDYVEDRLDFINTGTITHSPTKGRLNIRRTFETARLRRAAAHRYDGRARDLSLIQRLSQLVSLAQLPAPVRNLIDKVKSWTEPTRTIHVKAQFFGRERD